MLQPCAPTNSTGPCPLTVAGPLAAWMPPRSLQGRTCSVSRDGGRARALQPSCSSDALHSPLGARPRTTSQGLPTALSSPVVNTVRQSTRICASFLRQ
ncbi:hypothetical protein BI313_08330 [Xanthomonas vesicatoria]|nr:hypothetical protein BI313_08330 [Xanthomonas vesicatoria]